MSNQSRTLRRNVVSGYVSQIYISLIGVALLPVYLLHMGREAFGLVGFFTMLQGLFALLDIGLTPTVARETARYRGGAMSLPEYRSLLRALEGVFLLIALGGSLLLFSTSALIASDWLKTEQLSVSEVGLAIQFMAISAGLRWMCGFYRGVMSGSERLVLLTSFNSGIATIRFVGVLPILIFVSPTPLAFFSFQLVVAIVELVTIVVLVYRILPTMPQGQSVSWAWAPLKPVLKFSLTIAFTSSVWVLATQSDKLILSKVLTLSNYGSFTLAVLVASGITMLTAPISSAVMPRMVLLQASGDHGGLMRLYRNSTQLVLVLAGAAAATMAFCSEQLLWAYTGDQSVAREAAPVLTLYAIGNGILGAAAFPYYLQYARGNLRLHLIGNAVFVVLLVPLTIWAANRFGSIGAGYVWLGTNLAILSLWLPFVNHKLEPGLNAKWYFQDILPIVLAILVVGSVSVPLINWADDRLFQFGQVVCVGAILFIAGGAASSAARQKMLQLIKSVLDSRVP